MYALPQMFTSDPASKLGSMGSTRQSTADMTHSDASDDNSLPVQSFGDAVAENAGHETGTIKMQPTPDAMAPESLVARGEIIEFQTEAVHPNLDADIDTDPDMASPIIANPELVTDVTTDGMTPDIGSGAEIVTHQDATLRTETLEQDLLEPVLLEPEILEPEMLEPEMLEPEALISETPIAETPIAETAVSNNSIPQGDVLAQPVAATETALSSTPPAIASATPDPKLQAPPAQITTTGEPVISREASVLTVPSPQTPGDAPATTPVPPSTATPEPTARAEFTNVQADTEPRIPATAHGATRLSDMPSPIAASTVAGDSEFVTGLQTSMSAMPTANASSLMPALPVSPQIAGLTPLAGPIGLVNASVLQLSSPQGSVTIDRIPQAVVAVALTSKSATLQIDPPELGRIQLDYQFDTQGRTVVTLVPETEAARAALADRMATIVASLEQNSSGDVDVRLGDAQDFVGNSENNSGDGTGGESRSPDAPGSQSLFGPNERQTFIRPAPGQDGRLHILV